MKVIIFLSLLMIVSCTDSKKSNLETINNVFFKQLNKNLSKSIEEQNLFIERYVNETYVHNESNIKRKNDFAKLDSLSSGKVNKYTESNFLALKNFKKKFNLLESNFIPYTKNLDYKDLKKIYIINILNLKYEINLEYIKKNCNSVY